MFPENRLLELMIIGAVALIVVGPKDLPILMRRVGQFVGKMRGMANEFRDSFEDLARQSELEDLRKEVEAMRADHRSLTQLNPLAADYGAPGVTAPETPAAEAPALPPMMVAITPEPPAAEPSGADPAALAPKPAPKSRAKKPQPRAS